MPPELALKKWRLACSFGSMLVSPGVSIKAGQVAMGHANVTMALRVRGVHAPDA
jgi:hypothetical protein